MGCSQSSSKDASAQQPGALPSPSASATSPHPPTHVPSSSAAPKTSSDQVSVARGATDSSGTVSTAAAPAKKVASDRIQPNVGFVVKTMNILEDEEMEKLFLNVLHHEDVTTFCSYKSDTKSRTIYNVVIPSQLYYECEANSNLKTNISCQAIDHLNIEYNLKADASECIFVKTKLGYLSQ